MQRLLILLPFTTLAFMSSAQSSTNSLTKTTNSIIGTWQWVRVDQQPITQPFFVRYYTNGAAATWPAPNGWGTTNGVSHGGYHLEGEFLVLETGAGTNDPKAKIEIKCDEMTVIGDETNHLIYHRVVPDLEPGKFLPGQVNHGAPDI